MKYKADAIEDYIDALPERRKDAFINLRETILENIPKGFEEQMGYWMPGFVVPHSIYPDGYHCTPELPLPFISYASRKNFIALYHMGIYSNPELLTWFVKEYPKHCKTKLDLGKSCIRFKKVENIPYVLIAELINKMSVEEWISIYENNIKG